MDMLLFVFVANNMITVLDIKRVKARKPHYCDMCGKEIEIGEEYESQHLVYETPYTFHQCYRCKPYVDELWDTGFDDFYGEGLQPEFFETFMWEEHRDVICKWRGWDLDED